MERKTKELTCIGCPLGCSLQAVLEGNQVAAVTGNTCPRGDDYARKELTDPRRILTTTVRVTEGNLPVVSVKTVSDIPKNKLMQCMEELKKITLTAPVKTGQIVLKNTGGTGVDVAATKEIGRL